MTAKPDRAIKVDITPGELIDKITILEIKCARIGEPEKLRNIRKELELLTRARADTLASSPALDRLTAELRAANEALWAIEDDIRDCERRRDFGAAFIELARGVYKTNDRRSRIKRRINELLGAAFLEEKSYTPY
ncbi:MAG: hypothetical protein EXQ86_02715 [Rhodospirillales bacterium]|nr:hypothetical protein [Rhodospirillales bacterium]